MHFTHTMRTFIKKDVATLGFCEFYKQTLIILFLGDVPFKKEIFCKLYLFMYGVNIKSSRKITKRPLFKIITSRLYSYYQINFILRRTAEISTRCLKDKTEICIKSIYFPAQKIKKLIVFLLDKSILRIFYVLKFNWKNIINTFLQIRFYYNLDNHFKPLNLHLF